MEIVRKVWKNGDSLCAVIPKDVAIHCEFEDGSDIVFEPEEGKHGKYCSFWNKKHTDPNKRNNGANGAENSQ